MKPHFTTFNVKTLPLNLSKGQKIFPAFLCHPCHQLALEDSESCD